MEEYQRKLIEKDAPKGYNMQVYCDITKVATLLRYFASLGPDYIPRSMSELGNMIVDAAYSALYLDESEHNVATAIEALEHLRLFGLGPKNRRGNRELVEHIQRDQARAAKVRKEVEEYHRAQRASQGQGASQGPKTHTSSGIPIKRLSPEELARITHPKEVSPSGEKIVPSDIPPEERAAIKKAKEAAEMDDMFAAMAKKAAEVKKS